MGIVRRFNLSIGKFIQFNWLPTHMRTTNRLKELNVQMTMLKTIESDYRTWRDAVEVKANITNELQSIQWYLNYLFDPTLKRIYILTNKSPGLSMGIRTTETAKYQSMGIRTTEAAKYKTMTLKGEDAVLGNYDFGVFIPAALAGQEADITVVVKQFALAGKTFTYITF